MNDGWLWDSILKTTARPSPMSTAPAFSPGPCTTRGPSVGSVFRWMRLLLYEQCSDHITENRPSSVRLGSRPMCLTMRSYSSGLSPCLSSVALSMALGVNDGANEGFHDPAAVGGAQLGLAGALGMRHEADDVALGVADAGDGAGAAVHVGGVVEPAAD